MVDVIEMETERLRLRQWSLHDKLEFARISADPVVMEHFPAVLSVEESNAMAEKIQALIAQRGWGLWAVEHLGDGKYIGFVGLHNSSPALPIPPCVEIGWRLAKEYWGKGYATEAARVALSVAFEQLGLDSVYSFTSVLNLKSQALMRRLNMKNTQRNFDHPSVPEGNPLREHVLYELTRQQWKMGKTS